MKLKGRPYKTLITNDGWQIQHGKELVGRIGRYEGDWPGQQYYCWFDHAGNEGPYWTTLKHCLTNFADEYDKRKDSK